MPLPLAAPLQPPPAKPSQSAVPAPFPPLFFSEPWRQTGTFDASSEFQPAGGLTPAAVTNAQLELKVYDPAAGRIPEYRKNPPAGSRARDWGSSWCIQMSGYSQNPPPVKVVAGQPSDPPNLWTGICGPVAATLRDRSNYVDLSSPLAKIRWVTRTSGFHVVRPVLKLAN